jgi:hypothetical protein
MYICYDEISNMELNSILNNYKYTPFLYKINVVWWVKEYLCISKNVYLKYKIRFEFQVKIDFNSFVDLFSNILEWSDI